MSCTRTAIKASLWITSASDRPAGVRTCRIRRALHGLLTLRATAPPSRMAPHGSVMQLDILGLSHNRRRPHPASDPPGMKIAKAKGQQPKLNPRQDSPLGRAAEVRRILQRRTRRPVRHRKVDRVPGSRTGCGPATHPATDDGFNPLQGDAHCLIRGRLTPARTTSPWLAGVPQGCPFAGCRQQRPTFGRRSPHGVRHARWRQGCGSQPVRKPVASEFDGARLAGSWTLK